MQGNIKIGDGVRVGAGSVVITDIPPNTTAVGVPARVVGAKKQAPPPDQRPGVVMDQVMAALRNVWVVWLSEVYDNDRWHP